MAESCPACKKRDLDEKGRCWSKACGFRRCVGCGKNTGSVFLERCLLCEFGNDAGAKDTSRPDG